MVCWDFQKMQCKRCQLQTCILTSKRGSEKSFACLTVGSPLYLGSSQELYPQEK